MTYLNCVYTIVSVAYNGNAHIQPELTSMFDLMILQLDFPQGNLSLPPICM